MHEQTVQIGAGTRRWYAQLWPIALIVVLLTIIPAIVAGRGFLDGAWSQHSTDGPMAAMIDALIDGSQKSTVFVVAALAFLYFRKLASVLWSLVQPSLVGLLIAAEVAVVIWLVYGGLAQIGMPGLFWSPHPGIMMRAALGVTVFIYWMLYLSFVRDFDIHRKEPDQRVWARFRPVLKSSGLPDLFRQPVGEESAVGQLRWFLAFASLPALLALAIPAVLPALRPGDGPVIVEWPWLAGMALGVLATAVIVKSGAATRLHEFWRQLRERRLDFRRIKNLNPDRLDPHANTKNIMVMIAVILSASYLDEYFGGYGMRSLFPPAFSICVMLGLVATFATFLGTRSTTTRVAFVSALLALVATAGLLDYEVEVRDLHHWYPSALAQLRRRLFFDPSAPRRAEPSRALRRTRDRSIPRPPSSRFRLESNCWNDGPSRSASLTTRRRAPSSRSWSS